MSKFYHLIWHVFSAGLLILQFFTIGSSQSIDATISIDAKLPELVTVSGRFVEPRSQKNLSFMLDFAGISRLGERISDLKLTDAEGKAVTSRRMIAGEFLAEAEFSGWSYKVNLSPLKNQSAAAHLSWLTADGGIVMLDDILPQTIGRDHPAKVKFLLTSGKVISTEKELPAGSSLFEVANTEKSVFIIRFDSGSGREIRVGKSQILIDIAGDWQFSDQEASEMAGAIFTEYERAFGAVPTGNILIGLRKFPNQVATGNWEGDTRGRTVTIISSDMPFKSQSLQRLHEQLRHEVFHLWIPNGVSLTGNYDWFYEGFALYESLKIGVASNRIRFDDMLDTLSRAYDIDRFQSAKVSLVEASKNRWSGANTQIYARGMLVAFLCDLAMLDASKGKSSVMDIIRELYSKYRSPNMAADGNDAVISLMRTYPGLSAIVERNVTGAENIDWASQLKTAGIETTTGDQLTKLFVTQKPSGRQKDLLDKLGYNSWRKLSSK